MGATDIDAEATDHLLTTTRTVRRRLDLTKDVEPELIREAIGVATQAPTGGNLQRTRWVVVTDAAKRTALGNIYKRAMDPYHEIMGAVVDGTGRNRKVFDSSNYLVGVMSKVPVLVIPCELGKPGELKTLLESAGYPHPLTSNVGASGFYGSVWPAVWSFMLALRSRGLASALTTMHLALEEEAAELLGIPETVTQIGLIPVAHYTGDTFRPAKRRPAVETTYWESWKSQ